MINRISFTGKSNMVTNAAKKAVAKGYDYVGAGKIYEPGEAAAAEKKAKDMIPLLKDAKKAEAEAKAKAAEAKAAEKATKKEQPYYMSPFANIEAESAPSADCKLNVASYTRSHGIPDDLVGNNGLGKYLQAMG